VVDCAWVFQASAKQRAGLRDPTAFGEYGGQDARPTIGGGPAGVIGYVFERHVPGKPLDSG